MARYCIFRTDRIGDLVLTLPMAEAIKRHDPKAHVSFCVQDYTRALADLNPFIDECISIPARDLRGGVAAFGRVLKEHAFDVAVFAYPRLRLSLAARLAGIPVRVGIAYRWYSALYTHRRGEHRKPSLLHERDYNLNLLREIGMHPPEDLMPQFSIPPALHLRATAALEASGMPGDADFVVLHPGSGGSAKNWPTEAFAELAGLLTERHSSLHILVTGTEAERPLMTPVVTAGGDRAHALPGDTPLEVLAAVLFRAKLCVANSTGPLHIAAATGAPVLGLYPFETVCHPRRWGPLGLRSTVLLPPVETDCAACAAGACSQHDDMRRISTSTVLEAAELMLNGE